MNTRSYSNHYCDRSQPQDYTKQSNNGNCLNSKCAHSYEARMKRRKRKVHARVVESLVLILKKEKLTLKKCPEAKVNK